MSSAGAGTELHVHVPVASELVEKEEATPCLVSGGDSSISFHSGDADVISAACPKSPLLSSGSSTESFCCDGPSLDQQQGMCSPDLDGANGPNEKLSGCGRDARTVDPAIPVPQSHFSGQCSDEDDNTVSTNITMLSDRSCDSLNVKLPTSTSFKHCLPQDVDRKSMCTLRQDETSMTSDSRESSISHGPNVIPNDLMCMESVMKPVDAQADSTEPSVVSDCIPQICGSDTESDIKIPFSGKKSPPHESGIPCAEPVPQSRVPQTCEIDTESSIEIPIPDKKSPPMCESSWFPPLESCSFNPCPVLVMLTCMSAILPASSLEVASNYSLSNVTEILSLVLLNSSEADQLPDLTQPFNAYILWVTFVPLILFCVVHCIIKCKPEIWKVYSACMSLVVKVAHPGTYEYAWNAFKSLIQLLRRVQPEQFHIGNDSVTESAVQTEADFSPANSSKSQGRSTETSVVSSTRALQKVAAPVEFPSKTTLSKPLSASGVGKQQSVDSGVHSCTSDTQSQPVILSEYSHNVSVSFEDLVQDSDEQIRKSVQNGKTSSNLSELDPSSVPTSSTSCSQQADSMCDVTEGSDPSELVWTWPVKGVCVHSSTDKLQEEQTRPNWHKSELAGLARSDHERACRLSSQPVNIDVLPPAQGTCASPSPIQTALICIDSESKLLAFNAWVDEIDHIHVPPDSMNTIPDYSPVIVSSSIHIVGSGFRFTIALAEADSVPTVRIADPCTCSRVEQRNVSRSAPEFPTLPAFRNDPLHSQPVLLA